MATGRAIYGPRCMGYLCVVSTSPQNRGFVLPKKARLFMEFLDKEIYSDRTPTKKSLPSFPSGCHPNLMDGNKLKSPLPCK